MCCQHTFELLHVGRCRHSAQTPQRLYPCNHTPPADVIYTGGTTEAQNINLVHRPLLPSQMIALLGNFDL